MTSRVELRPLVGPDIDDVLPIERELFPGDPPWSVDIFRSELAGVPDTRWYVAAVEGTEIVGYAGLMHTGGPGEPADVTTIAVGPDSQRSGVGSLLMTALIDEAARRRAQSLLLEVRADNPAARAFYTRFGFEERARRRRYFADGTDGLVLARRM